MGSSRFCLSSTRRDIAFGFIVMIASSGGSYVVSSVGMVPAGEEWRGASILGACRRCIAGGCEKAAATATITRKVKDDIVEGIILM